MSDHAPGNSMAARIRFRRRAAGLTLDGLAAAAGISKTYLWELEADEGGSKRPSADVLLRIAGALETTLQDLMGLPGEPSMDDLLPIHLARAHLTTAAQELRRIPTAARERLGADWTARLGMVEGEIEELTARTYREWSAPRPPEPGPLDTGGQPGA